MTRTRTLAAATTAGLLALTVSACSDDNGSDPTGSSSSSSSSSTATYTPQDRSTQIFDAYTPRDEVLATTSGNITIGVSSTTVAPVKFAVTSVRATSDSTILRYELSSTSGEDELLGMSGRFWYDMPTLQAAGSAKKLQSVTASLPEGKRQKAQERCVCTSTDRFAPDPRPQMVMYPPLPEDATEVTITLNSLDPVTVTVSRQPLSGTL